jgi:hypothetical protein
MGWTIDVKDSVSYAAMTELTDALAYKLTWVMDAPATIEVLLNDDSGANTQIYGSTYLGTSAILVEQPTNTEIFRGRILSAEPNLATNTLTLHGADWLSQLEDRLVNYDTREILDPNSGNSMREYNLRPYLNDASRCNALWQFGGADTNIALAVDDLGDWTADDYNGCKIIFPYSYMGAQKDYCHAFNETVTPAAGAMNTDTPAAGEANTWVKDGTYHDMSQTEAAADCSFDVEYEFRSLAMAGILTKSWGIDEYAKKITVHLDCTVFGADVTDWAVQIRALAGAYYTIYESSASLPMTQRHSFSIDVPYPAIKQYDGNGYFNIRIQVNGNPAAGTTSFRCDYLMVEIDYETDTALTTHAYTIDDTVVSAGVYNHLDLDGDLLETAGVCDWWRFHISNKITTYVTALVNAYDALYALDATTDVTASTVYVGRHYHRTSPLDILRDLAKADGTNFWLAAWDGDSLDLQWGTSYALNGEPTWTDSTVLQWINVRQAVQDVTNQWFVEGYTSGDYKAVGDDSDAGSITAYGQRSQLINNPDIGNSADCEDYADAMVDRTHDLPFHVGAIIDGFSTVVVGAVVTVDSTKLFGAAGGPNADGTGDFVVTRKEYDSRHATTTFYLTPMQDALNMVKTLDKYAKDLSGRLTYLEQRLERGRRYTDLWS